MSDLPTQTASDYQIDSPDPNRGLWMLLGLILVIAGAFIFLRIEPSDIGSADALAAMLIDGQPKVLEFYSNF
jgi:hypothetical protein